MDGAYNQSSIDLVSVGFGPSGIAVAAAIDDLAESVQSSPLHARFYERQPSSAWHPNFILDGSDINHHFLRDLATPRNPRSRYTFTNYLKTKDRLYDFGLLGRSPSRQEWSDYIQWVAGQLATYVTYDEPVEDVTPNLVNGELMGFTVETSSSRSYTTSVVLSVGAQPFIPEPFQKQLGSRIFHTSEYLARVAALPQTIGKLLVIGAGQSAGEAILDLRRRFPNASIASIQRSSGFKLYDLGQFSNGVYCPAETDYFYALPQGSKAAAFADTVRTNYSGLDSEISAALYRQVYEDRVANSVRIALHTRRRIVVVRRGDEAISVQTADTYTGACETIEAEAIILATGFRARTVPDFMQKLRPLIRTGEDGEPLVNRDYSVKFAPQSRVGLYLNGLSEHSHGIGDGQSFSMIALRAGAILKSILERKAYAGSGMPQAARV
jgi:L-ornithine N5-monooxygenase